MSSYIAFVKSARPKLSKEFPELNFNEAMKYLSEKWKSMNEDDK